jgi:hypothetical protein
MTSLASACVDICAVVCGRWTLGTTKASTIRRHVTAIKPHRHFEAMAERAANEAGMPTPPETVLASIS